MAPSEKKTITVDKTETPKNKIIKLLRSQFNFNIFQIGIAQKIDMNHFMRVKHRE